MKELVPISLYENSFIRELLTRNIHVPLLMKENLTSSLNEDTLSEETLH
jgi:hypothetical protein